MTKDFMDDVGATDAGTLLSYGLNTEVSGIQGNFSSAGEGRDGVLMQTESRARPQNSQRVRGLARATLTRDYFLTSVPFDGYNTNAVTISRGANSLLFGLGSPGGVINNGLSRASLSGDFGEVRLRLGERGSTRFQVDYNKVINDRLAVRFALLEEDEQFQQRPSYEKTSRQYVAVNALLAKNEKVSWLGATKLRGNFENGKIEGTPVNAIPFYDGASTWFEQPDNVEEIAAISGKELPDFVVDGFTPKYLYDDINGRGGVRDNFGPLGTTFERMQLPYVYDSLTQTQRNAVGIQGGQRWHRSPNAPDDWRRSDPWSTVSYFSGSNRSVGFRPISITDTNIYDNRDLNLWGLNQQVVHDFQVGSMRLEQTFLDGKAGIELAVNVENYVNDEDLPGGSGRGVGQLVIDVAPRLMNGAPNPNVGRPMIFDAGSDDRDVYTEKKEAYQVTAFYELDFTQRDGWMSWLGSHVFTGFGSMQQNDDRWERWTHGLVDLGYMSNDSTDIFAIAERALFSGRRDIPTVVYVGPSLLGDQYQSLSDFTIDSYFKGNTPQTGEILTAEYQFWTPDYRGPEFDDGERLFTDDFLVREHLTWGGRSRREIDSKAFSIQSSFLDGHIVTILGWRDDTLTNTPVVEKAEWNPETRQYWAPNGTRDPASLSLTNNPDLITSQSGSTSTMSIVGHIPRDWLKLPMNSTLSLHYNTSENFAVSPARVNPFNEALPPPTGETTEYGFTIQALENRLGIRVNWFESKNQFATASRTTGDSSRPGFISSMLKNWHEAELEGIEFAQLMEWSAIQYGVDLSNQLSSYDDLYAAAIATLPEVQAERFRGFVDGDVFPQWEFRPGYSDTLDFVAEGFEVDITGKITDNLSINVNVAQQETVIANANAASFAYANMVADSMANSPLDNLASNPPTQQPNANENTPRTWTEEWIRREVNPIQAEVARNGQVSDEQREWRINAVMNYRFNDGFLEGFGVGFGLRYQSEVSTGYPIEVAEDGRIIPVISEPFMSPDEWNGDVWIKYEKRDIFESNIDWAIQLNVRNLYRSNTDFIPVATNPDGRTAVYRNPNPQVIYLTNTFSF